MSRPPDKRNGPPSQERAAASTTIYPQGTTPTQPPAIPRLPAAYASAYAPAGRRRRWLVVTGICPLDCGGRHAHYTDDVPPASGFRRAGCGRGAYWLVVSRVYRRQPVTEAAA